MTQPKTGKFTPGQKAERAIRGISQDGRLEGLTSEESFALIAQIIDEQTKAPEMYELLEQVDRAKNDMSDRKGTRLAWSNVVDAARRIKAAIDGEG